MIIPANKIPTGFNLPRNATIIAVNPYPKETSGCSWPIFAETSITPATPARPPDINNTVMVIAFCLKPANLAAFGAAPKTFILKPLNVLFTKSHENGINNTINKTP